MMNTANNKATLFLGDLSAFCTERDIHEIFAVYGEVMEIKIMRSEETNRNLSYGFIKFAHPTAAKKAMNALNGVLFCGRHLRIGWATYKNKKEPKMFQHHDRMDSSSVHVSYISYQLNCLITEESLRILFSSFGVVLDCSIKKSYIDENINRQCGYGFVHFSSSIEGIEAALASVKGLNDVTIDDVSYKCSISHNLEKQLMDLHTHQPQQQREPMMGMGNGYYPRHPSPPHAMMGFPENTFGNMGRNNMPPPQPRQSSYRVEAPAAMFNHHMNQHHQQQQQQSWNNNAFPPAFDSRLKEEMYFNQPPRPAAEFTHQNSPVFDSIDRNLVSRYRQKFGNEHSQFPMDHGAAPRFPEQMDHRFPMAAPQQHSANMPRNAYPQESRLMGLERQFGQLDMNSHVQQRSLLDELWLKPASTATPTEELHERESMGSIDSCAESKSAPFGLLEKTNSNSSTWSALSSTASLDSPAFFSDWNSFNNHNVTPADMRDPLVNQEIF